MSADHDNCYLCASDEGILLDIFGDAGQNLRKNIETCLSIKIERSCAPSSKICHKCAYELESCGKFLAKYKSLRDYGEAEDSAEPAETCCLCGRDGNKVRLLEINKGNSLNDSLRKIGQAIEKDFLQGRTIERLCVCLTCRYDIDVLSDLKSIHRRSLAKMKSTDKNGLKLSDVPKTRTRVVSRKTTCTPVPKLKIDPDCDSNASASSSVGARTRKGSRFTKCEKPATTAGATTTITQFRTCEECGTLVENGVDMYRYHRSGLTVCKDCWLTLDPEKVLNRKGKRLARVAPNKSTKLCAVFLKDVLSNPSKYSNIYRIERDKHGNATFLVTDESSENEDKEKRSESSAPSGEFSNDEARKRGNKRSTIEGSKTEDEGRPKRARPTMRRSQEPTESPRIVPSARRNNDVESDSGGTRITRGRRRSSDSTVNLESRINKWKRGMRADPPEGSEDSRLKTTSVPKRRGRPRKIVDNSASSDGPRKETRKKMRRDSTPIRATAASSTASSPDDGSSDEPKRSSEVKRNTLPVSPSANVALEDCRAENVKSESVPEEPYVCSVCRVVCVSKLDGKSHELTHEKQPEVKLRRITVPSSDTIHEVSPVRETKEEARRPSESKESVNHQPATLNTVIDDESTVVPPIAENQHDSEEKAEPSVLPRQKETIVDADAANDRQNHDEKREITEDRPSDEAEMMIDEKSDEAELTVEGKEKREEGMKADDGTGDGKVVENEGEECNDHGETPTTTETPRDDDATLPERTDASCLESKRTELIESPDESRRGNEVKNFEAVGSEERQIRETASETLSTTNETTDDGTREEAKSDLIAASAERDPVKDTSATIPGDDGSRSPVEVTEVSREKVPEDEKRNSPSPRMTEKEEERESVPAKIAHEEEEERGSTSSKVDGEEDEKREAASPKVGDKVEEELQTKNELDVVEAEAEEERKEEREKTSSKPEEDEEDKEPEATSVKVADDEEDKRESTSSKVEEAEGDEREKTPLKVADRKNEERESTVSKSGGKNDDGRQSKEEPESAEAEVEKVERERRVTIGETKVEKPSDKVTLPEVFDLASAEVKKRLENGDWNERPTTPAETLENISLEIQKSADTPTLEIEKEAKAIERS